MQIADAAYRTIMRHINTHRASVFDLRESGNARVVFELYLDGNISDAFELFAAPDAAPKSVYRDILPLVAARLEENGLRRVTLTRIFMDDITSSASTDVETSYMSESLRVYARTESTPSQLQIAASWFNDHPPGKVALMKNMMRASEPSSDTKPCQVGPVVVGGTLAVAPTTLTAIESTAPASTATAEEPKDAATTSSVSTSSSISSSTGSGRNMDDLINGSVDAIVNKFASDIIGNNKIRSDHPIMIRVANGSFYGPVLEVTQRDEDRREYFVYVGNLGWADVIIRLLRVKLEAHGTSTRDYTTTPTTDSAPTPETASIVPRPTTPDEFFLAVGLTPEQQFQVLRQLPNRTASMFMLCCGMDTHLLYDCRLTQVQINAWQCIAMELLQ